MSAKEMEGTLAKSSMVYTDDLTDLPIKEINKRLEDQPRDITQAVKRKGINKIEEKVYSSWRFFVFHLSLFQDSSTAVDATNVDVENVCYYKTKIIEGDEVTYC